MLPLLDCIKQVQSLSHLAFAGSFRQLNSKPSDSLMSAGQALVDPTYLPYSPQFLRHLHTIRRSHPHSCLSIRYHQRRFVTLRDCFALLFNEFHIC
jgi:hypothetical protein